MLDPRNVEAIRKVAQIVYSFEDISLHLKSQQQIEEALQQEKELNDLNLSINQFKEKIEKENFCILWVTVVLPHFGAPTRVKILKNLAICQHILCSYCLLV